MFKCATAVRGLHFYLCARGKSIPGISQSVRVLSRSEKSPSFDFCQVDMHRRTGRGGAGGAAAPPPIRAVCRHEFGQRVDIIRAKHNTCLNNPNLGSFTAKNTNLGSVMGVNGKNSGTPHNMDPGKFLLLPPPPPHRIWIPENFCYYPPPPPPHPYAYVDMYAMCDGL